MQHRIQRSTFLRPRERLHELLVLQQAGGEGGISRRPGGAAMLDHRTLAGYLDDLVARGLLEEDADYRLQLTESGRTRLHYLLVDFANELHRLNDSAGDILRRSLVPLALTGARRVAFFPFGETAEVTQSVLESVGLELVAIVDDSPRKWDVRFHGLRVQPPATLRELQLDAVIVTTAVFQDRIVARIGELDLRDVQVHLL